MFTATFTAPPIIPPLLLLIVKLDVAVRVEVPVKVEVDGSASPDIAASLIGDLHFEVIGSGNVGGADSNTGVTANETAGRASNKPFVEDTDAGEAWGARLLGSLPGW